MELSYPYEQREQKPPERQRQAPDNQKLAEVVLLEAAGQLRESVLGNRLAEAKEQTEKLLPVLQQGLDYQPETVALTYAALGKYYQAVQQYQPAIDFYQQAIPFARQLEDKELYVSIHWDYAKLEKERGDIPKAKALLVSFLTELEQGGRQDVAQLGLTYRLLGEICLQEHNYGEASRLLQTAYDYLNEQVQITNPMITQTVSMLTEALVKMNQYKQAVAVNQSVLEAKQAMFNGENKVIEAESLLEIAVIYMHFDLKKARRTLSDVIKLLEGTYEDKQLKLARAYLLLAETEEDMQKQPRALKYYKQALEYYKTVPQEAQYMIIYAYSRIGFLLLNVGDAKEAQHYLENGLVLAENYPKFKLQFLNALGRVYADTQAYEKSIASLQEFLAMMEAGGRKGTKEYADALQFIGLNYFQQKQLATAVSYYEKAVAVYESLSPSQPEATGITYLRLAGLQVNRQEIDKAENCYDKAVSNIEQLNDPPLVEKALKEAIEFADRFYKSKKRKKYANKLTKLQAMWVEK